MSKKDKTVINEDVVKDLYSEIHKLSEQINRLEDKIKTVSPLAEVCKGLEEEEQKIIELEPWKNYIKEISKQNEELTKKHENVRNHKWLFISCMMGGGIFLFSKGG